MIWFAALTATFLFNGCTVIGMIIGGVSDSKKPKPYTVSISDTIFLQLDEDTYLVCYLENGKKRRGRYLGKFMMTNRGYLEEYKDFQKEQTELLPPLFDTVTVFIQGQENRTLIGAFYGFDKGKILLTNKKEWEEYIRSANLDSTDRLVTVSSVSIDQDELKKIDERVPYRSAIRIRNDNGVFEIPINKIIMVRVNKKKTDLLIGGISGLVLDGIIIALIISSGPFTLGG